MGESRFIGLQTPSNVESGWFPLKVRSKPSGGKGRDPSSSPTAGLTGDLRKECPAGLRYPLACERGAEIANRPVCGLPACRNGRDVEGLDVSPVRSISERSSLPEVSTVARSRLQRARAHSSDADG